MDAKEVIDRQLEYYNAHDLDGFCSTYHDDVEILLLGSGEALARGKVALKERYAARLATPGLKAELRERITVGAYVTDHEYITCDNAPAQEAVVSYLVEDGLIRRAWMHR